MAPIILKKFAWSQTSKKIIIQVPYNGLKPISSNNTDVFACDQYLKVNAQPYFFEIFLAYKIKPEASRLTLANENFVFELEKEDALEWENIEQSIPSEEKSLLRKEIECAAHRKVEDEKEKRKCVKLSLKQQAVQAQISLDSSKRQSIEKAKNNEIIMVSRAIENWKENGKLETDTSHQLEIPKKGVLNSAKSDVNETKVVTAKKLSKVPSAFPIPLVRQNGTIHVTFSLRDFPTPSRESLLQDEKEFLKKQLAARKSAGFVSEDLRPEEKNPVWLKNKGDTFYRYKNYLGAISAYSHAIDIGSQMPELYCNRSICHFKIGNLHKALEDTSTAIELLTPPVLANMEARAKCHARRGIILCKLGLPEKSLCEFEEALKLRPDDQQLHEDYERAKSLAQDDDSDSS